MNQPLYIRSTLHADILQAITGAGITGLHATNGTYAYAADMILPTSIAGFQFITDRHAGDGAALLLAVNSDRSMQDMMNAKKASQAERDALEDQDTRANKIALLLAEQFPDRRIVVAFYDEADPAALYAALGQGGQLRLHSLHKWGYGASDDAKPILGAEYFENVYGFPLPASVAATKPVAWNVTPDGQLGHVQVVDLARQQGRHGAAFINANNRLLAPVCAGLQRFRATAVPGVAASRLQP